mmetsp:Transcript_108347/g.271571  ORF Transcript_108347/g.271571 Transcript_108347/m.271571 type:complete len:341 (-) Transcript_108347:250-1272(-)
MALSNIECSLASSSSLGLFASLSRRASSSSSFFAASASSAAFFASPLPPSLSGAAGEGKIALRRSLYFMKTALSPRRMIRTWLSKFCISTRGWWSVMMTGTRFETPLRSWVSLMLEAVSNPLVGSSNIIAKGLLASSAQTAVILRCPCDNAPSCCSISSLFCKCAPAMREFLLLSFFFSTPRPAANARASETVSSKHIHSSCGTYPTMARSCLAVTACPLIVMLPAAGCTRPQSIFSSVVFPEPQGPTMPSNWPVRTPPARSFVSGLLRPDQTNSVMLSFFVSSAAVSWKLTLPATFSSPSVCLFVGGSSTDTFTSLLPSSAACSCFAPKAGIVGRLVFG